MQTVFGHQNDFRHIEPKTEGGYEWWYFDALSEDGCFALVVIFFLGAPMTAYYRNVLLEKSDTAHDWSGVFVTLHRRGNPTAKWNQAFYGFNLYADTTVSDDGSRFASGNSTLLRNGNTWNLKVRESGIWTGNIVLNATFTDSNPIALQDSPAQSAERHGWACVAPQCRTTVDWQIGTIKGIFNGDGYHDHNWGILPFDSVEVWYWSRATFSCSDGVCRTVILYYTKHRNDTMEIEWICIESNGAIRSESMVEIGTDSEYIYRYGLRHASKITVIGADFTAALRFQTDNAFANGPFYRRLPVQVTVTTPNWSASGDGIGEIFRPSRLGGVIVGNATWTRVRRRNSPPTP